MPDLSDGESTEITSSSGSKYILKNVGGVYSCSCPAWRNQSAAIDLRSCKHLKQFRGAQAEADRIGGGTAATPAKESEETSSKGPPILLANPWDNEQDLTGWWLSEKLDGVRAYWNGKQFLSRQGNQFFAPTWFTAGLPATPLDGELWLDRKQFQQTVSVVRRANGGDAWTQIKYVVFDAPAAGGSYELRQKSLKTVSEKCAYASVLDQILCQGIDHLRQELTRIEALGGEGLMLRQPESLYEPGRSATLLKVKTFHDAEATVVGHVPGRGRHKGRLGALEVTLADGTKFSVGTGFSDAQRGNPPTIGTVITFRFQELTSAGVPRFPSFLRIRSDKS